MRLVSAIVAFSEMPIADGQEPTCEDFGGEVRKKPVTVHNAEEPNQVEL